MVEIPMTWLNPFGFLAEIHGAMFWRNDTCVFSPRQDDFDSMRGKDLYDVLAL